MHKWQCLEMDDGGSYCCRICGTWHHGTPPPKVECSPDLNSLLFKRLTNLAKLMQQHGSTLVLLKSGEIDDRYKLNSGYVPCIDLLYGMANCFLESPEFTNQVKGKWVLTQCDEKTLIFLNMGARPDAVGITDFFAASEKL